jgi:hypothetical protein
MQPAQLRNDVLAVLMTVGFLELIRTAWISDNAAITLRCVLNLLHGYGATFNIDERVPALHSLTMVPAHLGTLRSHQERLCLDFCPVDRRVDVVALVAPDARRAEQRVMQALMQMTKLDIARLQQAAES